MPFEVKYRSTQHTGVGELKGMLEFCADRKVPQGYVITRDFGDFGVLPVERDGQRIQLLKIPAPLACYWLGRSELESAARDKDEAS